MQEYKIILKISQNIGNMHQMAKHSQEFMFWSFFTVIYRSVFTFHFQYIYICPYIETAGSYFTICIVTAIVRLIPAHKTSFQRYLCCFQSPIMPSKSTSQQICAEKWEMLQVCRQLFAIFLRAGFLWCLKKKIIIIFFS